MAENTKKRTTANYLLFFVLALIVVAAMIMLFPVYRSLQKKQSELGELNEKLNNRIDESTRLNTEVAGLSHSPDEVEKVAREKFGLVKDGERVLRYPPPIKDK
ncbi:MAG: septum formation initiator family protein [Victivallales bacterium]|jgi:cell division protein FtsB|nr:septum formation initiator family protein [Victivallales bacterium]